MKLLISIFVIIFISFGIYWYFNDEPISDVDNFSNEEDVVMSNAQFPETPSSLVQPDRSTRAIFTRDGRQHEVRDFLEDEVVVSLGEGLYQITPLSSSDETVYFEAIFNETDSSFAIALLERPFALSRQIAATEIKEKLGLPESVICEMNIFVGVPFDIDPNLAGQNLGLSYCPGAAEL